MSTSVRDEQGACQRLRKVPEEKNMTVEGKAMTRRRLASAAGIAVAAGLLFAAARIAGRSFLLWHIPAAAFTYLGFVACVIVNIVIAARKKGSLRAAQACCDVGLFFGAVTCTTGMAWARVAWGTLWVWEPRLTGMFLTMLIFLSWRIASGIIASRVVAHKAVTSVLIVFGLPSIAFTHFATRLLGGVHPDSVLTGYTFPPPAAFILVIAAYAFISAAILLFALTPANIRRKMNCEKNDLDE